MQHLIEQCHESPKRAVIYWYCDFRDTPPPSLEEVVASLVDQLVSQATYLSPTLYNAYDSRARDPLSARSLDVLETSLRELLGSFDDVYLCVDALDEVQASQHFMSQIMSIHKHGTQSLHMLLTSQTSNLALAKTLGECC